LLAFIPLIAIVGVLNLPESILSWEGESAFLTKIVWPLLLFVGMIAANLLAYSVVSAVTVPIVIQAMVAPLRPVRLRTAFAALKRRWLAFSATSVAITAMILLGSLFFVVPGVFAAICFALYAPVVVMEEHGVLATLKRARRLMKRSWHTVLVITLLQFALPTLVWLVSVDSGPAVSGRRECEAGQSIQPRPNTARVRRGNFQDLAFRLDNVENIDRGGRD
jgi:hypothetical protein